MSVDVRMIDRPTPGDVDRLVAVVAAADLDDDRDVPPRGHAEITAGLFVTPAYMPQQVWLATVAGEARAMAGAQTFTDGANDRTAELEIVVHPAWRRRGIGTEVWRRMSADLRSSGRDIAIGFPWTDGSRRFAEALGMRHCQDERCSRLDVTSVPDDLLEAWTLAPRARAEGYRLVGYDASGPPADQRDAFADALLAMEDAPLGDLTWTQTRRTADQIRERFEIKQRQGVIVAGQLALAPDGTAAGMTEIVVHRERPVLGHQGDTAVVASHRGRRLGRWMKAENLRLIREHVPELRLIETHNAQDNPWMLAINVDLGFGPHRIHGSYEGPLAT